MGNILKLDIDLQGLPGGPVVKMPSANAGDIGEVDSTQTPVFCLENPRDGGAWWAAV